MRGFLGRSASWPLLAQSAAGYSKHNAPRMGAALAYYTLLFLMAATASLLFGVSISAMGQVDRRRWGRGAASFARLRSPLGSTVTARRRRRGHDKRRFFRITIVPLRTFREARSSGRTDVYRDRERNASRCRAMPHKLVRNQTKSRSEPLWRLPICSSLGMDFKAATHPAAISNHWGCWRSAARRLSE
jgi:hypothetical protein